jgi:hypothetical protein
MKDEDDKVTEANYRDEYYAEEDAELQKEEERDEMRKQMQDEEMREEMHALSLR